jgi:uncharacterized protein YggL (DUF469 family)
VALIATSELMSAPCPLFGFIVTTRLRDTSPDADTRTLIDDLVEVLESNDLSMSGGGNRNLKYVVSREGSQATHTDRELVLAWAERWGAIAEIEVSDLVDLRDA